MLPADLYCYEENRGKFSLPKKIKGFAEAIWEIEEDPDLVISLGKPPSKKRRQCSTPTVGHPQPQQEQVRGSHALRLIFQLVFCRYRELLTPRQFLHPVTCHTAILLFHHLRLRTNMVG